jgi:hypothetical protein
LHVPVLWCFAFFLLLGSAHPTGSEPKLPPQGADRIGRFKLSEVYFLGFLGGVKTPTRGLFTGSVHAAGSESELFPGKCIGSLGTGCLAFASAVCSSLEESRLPPGGSASPVGSLCKDWDWVKKSPFAYLANPRLKAITTRVASLAFRENPPLYGVGVIRKYSNKT